MKPPCMTIVKHALPAIRALIAKNLTEEHCMKKIEAARKLGLSPAALTQYQKGIRGKGFTEKILQSKKAVKLISQTAEALTKNDETSSKLIMVQLCKICQTLRAEGIICEAHRKDFPELENAECVVCKNPLET